MNAEVHTPVGVATAAGLSLIIPAMKIDSVPTLIVCTGCAALGSILPDIDANGDSVAKKQFRKVISFAIISLAIISLYYLKEGYFSKLVDSMFTPNRGWFTILFLGLCLYGYHSDHRTFTHWLIGLLSFTITFTIMVGSFTYGLWFGAAFLSHQLIDCLNKRKIYWLYPLKIDFARYICYANSTMSTIIGGIASIFIIVLYLYLGVNI